MVVCGWLVYLKYMILHGRANFKFRNIIASNKVAFDFFKLLIRVDFFRYAVMYICSLHSYHDRSTAQTKA
jgi:hypothetical protein